MFVMIYTILALIVTIILNWILVRGKKRKPQKQHRKSSTQSMTTSNEPHQSQHTFTLDDDHSNAQASHETHVPRQPVNEKVADATQDFVFKKGTTRSKVLVAMIFGMFIAILNQTLLNTALPQLNTDFNISASTGQWLMTGFMLVNGILIPISAFLFNKYSYRRLFLIAMLLFTIGSFVCGIAWGFPNYDGWTCASSDGCRCLNATWYKCIYDHLPT